MAEIQNSDLPSASDKNEQTASSGPAPEASAARPMTVPLHKLYALPAPIRTFPLPTFYPSNPLSLFHLAYAWLSQALFPPPIEPSVIYQGVWSPESNSVHILDERSMRGLWEQGFYGKGSLSRSEPNWLKREKVRRGLMDGLVAEQLTLDRREERRQAKWERAKAELDAIRQVQLEESSETETSLDAESAEAPALVSEVIPPVGPLELLALPNSNVGQLNGISQSNDTAANTDTPLLPPSKTDTALNQAYTNGHVAYSPANGIAVNGTTNGAAKGPVDSKSSTESPTAPVPLKRQKSVRFSPKVESTTFQLSDPPSPNYAMLNGKSSEGILDGAGKLSTDSAVSQNNVTTGAVQRETSSRPLPSSDKDIVNLEHLQLTPEEALFLTFGLGALTVLDPITKAALSIDSLLTIFRQHCYFPTRPVEQLEPSDSFLINYAVYHHFRSLGWVPRAGLKFGVDWLLYVRGPVFDHAEFGVIIMPSYSHPLWEESGAPQPQKSWQWLHGVNRVLSHVMKTLVLVYVEVPPPSLFDEALKKGPAAVLKLYKIQEVIVRRWSSNRNR